MAVRTSITVNASVSAQTTIDSIDNAPTAISSYGVHVIAWVDSTDSVYGTASVHSVANFAGGVSKASGASLANPSDAGTTMAVKQSLFGTGPAPSDINQGGVGDCFFLAAIAAFANQQPGTILNSAVDLGDGTYAVQFYSNGSPVFVRVNNTFTTGGWNGLNFAHPGANNTIWAMVMEKAFCWFRNGSNTYSSISGGWMGEVYTDLNAPSTMITPSAFSDTQLFNMLSTDLQDNVPVTFCTFGSVSGESPAPDLVSCHAYTLLGTKTVNGVNEYIVRNPWGSSGDALESSLGIATLTYAQLIANFDFGAVAA